MTEQEIAKAQFEWDTLLVAGWRKFWSWNQTRFEFRKLGYDLELLKDLRRGTVPKHLWKAPIRAMFDQLLHGFSKRLWACKQDKDFIAVRNLLNSKDPDLARRDMKPDYDMLWAKKEITRNHRVMELSSAELDRNREAAVENNRATARTRRRHRSLA